jgi:hypothetical protein
VCSDETGRTRTHNCDRLATIRVPVDDVFRSPALFFCQKSFEISNVDRRVLIESLTMQLTRVGTDKSKDARKRKTSSNELKGSFEFFALN